MRKINVIGVDLAKNVMQVSVVSGSRRELSAKSYTRKKFAEFLARQKPSLVAFEACGTSHHWARFARRYGHEVMIIRAKTVAKYREGHKTDANNALVKQNAACKELLALEGIGPIGAVLLFATLGTGEAFTSARQFAAYLGLTPKQYSSGGKVKLVGISKKAANKRLRAVLVQGARAYVRHLKEPKTAKDRWLQALIDRAGTGKATVALAHKNARTAWAMLTRAESYQRDYQHEVLAA